MGGIVTLVATGGEGARVIAATTGALMTSGPNTIIHHPLCQNRKRWHSPTCRSDLFHEWPPGEVTHNTYKTSSLILCLHNGEQKLTSTVEQQNKAVGPQCRQRITQWATNKPLRKQPMQTLKNRRSSNAQPRKGSGAGRMSRTETMNSEMGLQLLNFK